MIKWFIDTKKGRLILGIALLFLATHIWLTWRIHRFVDHFCQASITGESLSHPDVVLVRDNLLEQMKKELNDGYIIKTKPYDAFEFDFPKCTHTAYVITATHKKGLRLRFDPIRNQFHVVGYWTIK